MPYPIKKQLYLFPPHRPKKKDRYMSKKRIVDGHEKRALSEKRAREGRNKRLGKDGQY